MKSLYPFNGATIFISHRCSDHKISDAINSYFQRRKQNTFYSCDADATPNKNVFPLQELRNSDVFLFLISSSSLETDSFSWKEYEEAHAMETKGELIVVRCLIDKKARFKNRMGASEIVQQFDVDSIESSCENLLQVIHKKIIDSFSLIKIKKMCSAHSYYYNDTSYLLIKRLFDFDIMKTGYEKPFALNFMLRSIETAKLIGKFKTLEQDEKENFIEFLENIILYADDFYRVAKQNAIYLLGKLLGNNDTLTREVLKRMPGISNCFYYRGFCVGISYLSRREDIGLGCYVNNMIKKYDDSEWENQRKLNILYHLQYYHSKDELLIN